MERRGEKLDAAREKLAKQKPPKKPGAVKRLAHTAGHGVHGFVHGKLYEVEHENVGTEGAHRSELVAEQQELVALCAKGNRELIAKQKEVLGDILR